ncbi:MAG: hypothetical protein V4736_00885, partial [Bdellovibrionota bacterium]
MRASVFMVFSTVLVVSNFAHAIACKGVLTPKSVAQKYKENKARIKMERTKPDREGGLVQITGKDLKPGQTSFPERTPADPFVFEDAKTGEIHVYGTQVDGTGFSFLKYKRKSDFLRGKKPEIVNKKVYLPNGTVAEGKEAIWDTYRLSYETLSQVFSKEELELAYGKQGIDKGSDLYFGGVALQKSGDLGRWTTDNWRRRVHPIGTVNNRLQILKDPVFNKIKDEATETDYPGFGMLPFLPGNYIGHAYGPNFKLVKNNEGTLELWVISEEVTRRVDANGKPAEVTEIIGRKMISPFQASPDGIVMVSVNGKDGKPHPDSDRGPEMGNTKLLEGFRPTSVTPEGLR